MITKNVGINNIISMLKKYNIVSFFCKGFDYSIIETVDQGVYTSKYRLLIDKDLYNIESVELETIKEWLFNIIVGLPIEHKRE